MTQPSLHVEARREGPVGRLVLSRPERFNSLDVRTAQDLRRAALSLARDESVRVVVFSGVPGAFCSGADLKYIRAGGDDGDLGYLRPVETRRTEEYGTIFQQILEYLHSTISEIRRAPKPFIAAVDGIAAAGGLGLAMCCDLVIASERSSFEFAYGRTGLSGAESSTFFLPRLVGFRKAMELVLLNPRLSAREAKEAGLVTRVFRDASFPMEVDRIAAQLAAGPTLAWAAAKSLLNESMGGGGLDGHLDRELAALARIADGADFAEGLAAFVEKRPPRFAGREPRAPAGTSTKETG